MAPKKRGRGPGIKRRLAETQLIELLVTGTPVAAAAQRVGLAPRTAYRILAENAEFKQKLQRRKTEIYEGAGRAAIALGISAVVTLGTLKDDTMTPPSVRAQCARSLLEVGKAFWESFELDERLSEVERRLAERDA